MTQRLTVLNSDKFDQKNPPLRRGFLFTMFPDQAPCIRDFTPTCDGRISSSNFFTHGAWSGNIVNSKGGFLSIKLSHVCTWGLMTNTGISPHRKKERKTHEKGRTATLHDCYAKRERERGRKREKERGRERGRERKRERDREREREKEREKERERERERGDVPQYYILFHLVCHFFVSNLNRWSGSVGLFCHVPFARNQRDCDQRLKLNYTPNVIDCTRQSLPERETSNRNVPRQTWQFVDTLRFENRIFTERIGCVLQRIARLNQQKWTIFGHLSWRQIRISLTSHVEGFRRLSGQDIVGSKK